jgi:hypothetical protein
MDYYEMAVIRTSQERFTVDYAMFAPKDMLREFLHKHFEFVFGTYTKVSKDIYMAPSSDPDDTIVYMILPAREFLRGNQNG